MWGKEDRDQRRNQKIEINRTKRHQRSGRALQFARSTGQISPETGPSFYRPLPTSHFQRLCPPMPWTSSVQLSTVNINASTVATGFDYEQLGLKVRRALQKQDITEEYYDNTLGQIRAGKAMKSKWCQGMMKNILQAHLSNDQSSQELLTDQLMIVSSAFEDENLVKKLVCGFAVTRGTPWCLIVCHEVIRAINLVTDCWKHELLARYGFVAEFHKTLKEDVPLFPFVSRQRSPNLRS